MKRELVFLLYIVLFSGLALAHGNEKHVLGTVTQISHDAVTVHTTKNGTVEVLIAPETKFMKGTESAAAKDLHVGDRVVIHAVTRKDGKLVAHTVQIGVAKPQAFSPN